MLQHMIKAQILNRVITSMNMLIRITKRTLNHECRRIASLRSRSVIRAGISTFRLNIWDVAILFSCTSVRIIIGKWSSQTYLSDNFFDESGEGGVDKVGDDSHALRLPGIQSPLHISSHILL
jgi:hypothetical protein